MLCPVCSADVLGTSLAAIQRQKQLEQREHDVRAVCATCASLSVRETDACESTDCPVLYSRVKAGREHRSTVELFQRLSVNIPSMKEQQDPIYLVV